MLDATQLATVAVAVLSPYFVEAAKKAAGKVGEETYEGGKKVVSWLREKLSPDDTKALDRVAADPSNADKQAALRVSLAETLAANPALQIGGGRRRGRGPRRRPNFIASWRRPSPMPSGRLSDVAECAGGLFGVAVEA